MRRIFILMLGIGGLTLTACFGHKRTAGGDVTTFNQDGTVNTDKPRTGVYTPVLKGNDKPVTPTKPVDKPIEQPKNPIKPVDSRRDTVVVTDTVRSGTEWLVVRRTLYLGRVLDEVTIEHIPLVSYEKPKPNPKSTYSMAIMLPFLTNLYESGRGVPEKSKRAAEFYEGVQLACQDLETEGIVLDVHTFDTQGDTNVLKTLLNNEAVSNADVLFGPVTTENLQLTAKYGLANNKPVVSPLNPTEIITGKNYNPNFVQLVPSNEGHLMGMLDYIRRHFRRYSMLALTRNDKVETALAQSAKDMSIALGNPRTVQLYQTGADNKFTFESIKAQLSTRDTNVIIIPSWKDEGWINGVIHTLAAVEGYKIVVFGMPRWFDYTKTTLDDYAKINLHLSRDTYEDRESTEIVKFRRRFFKAYNLPPGELSYKGYDTMLFIGRMLKKYGTAFPAYLSENTKDDYLCTQFNVKGVYEYGSLDGSKVEQQKLRYFGNQYINILRYDIDHFVKVF